MATGVAILARGPQQRAAAESAAVFLAKGESTVSRVIAASADRQPDELVVGFTDDPGVHLRLVDSMGRDWESGLTAADALYAGRDDVEVRLVDSQSHGATGSVGVLRSVAATVAAGRAVLGPLILRYLAGERESLTNANPVGGPSIGQADRRGTVRFAGRLLRAAVTARNWQVARLSTDVASLAKGLPQTEPVRWQGPRRRAFWADPCVVTYASQEWVFVEELGRRSGLGVIRAARATPVGLSGQQVVLRTDHHLSYPQIYRVADRWLASVETCGAHNPFYTFDALGQPWREATDLPALPAHLADAVAHFDGDGRLREVSGTDATVNADAVFVRYVWEAGAWHRDDAATVVDVRLSRGGGSDDRRRGLRAVQDCAGTYGRAAALVDLAGKPVVHFTPDDLPRRGLGRRRKGVHTLTWPPSGEVVWCDGWLRRVTALGGYWRLRERAHSAGCLG